LFPSLKELGGTSEKPGYKATEMGEIPYDWELTTLGEIATDFISGGTPSTSNSDYWNGKIPWMRSASIKNRFVDSGERFISENGLKNSATNIVPQGSLLIASRVSIGNVAISRIDVAISQDLTGIVIDKKRANAEYLYWILKYRRHKLESYVQGSTIKGVLREDLKSLCIPLPSLREQERIASVLSTVDDDIQKTDEIIAKTQHLKKGLAQQLLTSGIEHREFKRTEIGKLPISWNIVALEDLLIEPIRNGYSPLSSSTETGRWILALSALSDDGLKPNEVKPAPANDPRLDRCKLLLGDILVSRSNTRELVGRAGMYQGRPQSCYYPDLMMRVRVDRDRMDISYLEHWLRHHYTRRYLMSNARGTSGSMVKINSSILSKLIVPLPAVAEQRDIVARLSTIETSIANERESRVQLVQLRKGLMQSLLTGKVRMTVN
jgi:type I restriction enzyme S subunit